MFCKKCGNKLIADTKFCEKCGAPKEIKNEVPSDNHISQQKDYTYSRNWKQSKTFVVAAFPHFDILLNKDGFFLLKLPNYYAAAWGTFLGLIIFRLIGAVIGAAIGNGIDRKKRKTFSLKWADANDNIVSNEYEGHCYLKIPADVLKDHLIVKNNKLLLNYNDKKITLRNDKKERDRLFSALRELNIIKTHA